jgi:hypothetical protein
MPIFAAMEDPSSGLPDLEGEIRRNPIVGAASDAIRAEILSRHEGLLRGVTPILRRNRYRSLQIEVFKFGFHF